MDSIQPKSSNMKAIHLRESRIAIAVLFAVFFNFGILKGQAQLSVQTNQLGFYSLELNGQFHDFNQSYFTLQQIPGMHYVRLHHWIQGVGNQGVWNVIYQGSLNLLAMQNTLLRVNPGLGVQVQYLPIQFSPTPAGTAVFPNPMQPGFMMGMDAAAFQHFLQELGRISFDSNRLNYAQFAIRKNGIFVHQLQLALSKFSFDSGRLELAKFAYPFTIDRQNYFMLQNSFTFQSNFRKLMESI